MTAINLAAVEAACSPVVNGVFTARGSPVCKSEEYDVGIAAKRLILRAPTCVGVEED